MHVTAYSTYIYIYMLTLLMIMTCNNGRNGRHMTRIVISGTFLPYTFEPIHATVHPSQ